MMLLLAIAFLLYASYAMLSTAILPAVAVVVTVAGLFRIIDRWNNSFQRKQDEYAAILARADKQHNEILNGDWIGGTYGEYLPPHGLR